MISEQNWAEHNLPLWNPYAAYGTPLAAAMQPQPFFPLTALLSIHPGARTFNLFVLSRLFVAGLLMYLFARMFVGHLPSVLAVASFMLTGRFIVAMDMPYLSVEGCTPRSSCFIADRDCGGQCELSAMLVSRKAAGGVGTAEQIPRRRVLSKKCLLSANF